MRLVTYSVLHSSAIALLDLYTAVNYNTITITITITITLELYLINYDFS